MCRHFSEDFGLITRVARFHNVYGPYGNYDGGREKAPAAVCRKVIEAGISGDKEIVIWGDRYPDGGHEQNAKLLFGAENPPVKIYISGSQDHIGLISPGINRL
jgi:nucleoside-diphosphate-sugar epimerase